MMLENLVSENNIVRLLCKYRANEANKRHKKHMIRNLSLHERSNNIKIKDSHVDLLFLQSVLPSRRSWVKVSQRRRKELKDSIKINQIRLFDSYKQTKWEIEKKNAAPPSWYVRLIDFVNEIRNSILNFDSSSFSIAPPIVTGIKKGIKNNTIIYRPIAIYCIKEKIICSITAKYLTAYFDPIFHDCSFAFRAKDANSNKIPNHHDCIEKILNFRKDYNDLWVAECDIQKFFDTVQHEHVIKIFGELSTRIEVETGQKMDWRISNIFIEFLKSFNFKDNIYIFNDNKEWFQRNNIPFGKFPWVEKELNSFYGDNYTKDNVIGVPQGNAISCFISNLILHNVDDKVLAQLSKGLYIRYCDDMVLMSTDEQTCQRALDIYMEEIKRNFLLFHNPEESTNYRTKVGRRTFWNLKSKKPFHWGNKDLHPTNVPWVSFVGYQINYQGKIRIRKSTIEKETKKQILETQKVLRYLGKLNHYNFVKNEHSRLSKRQIKYSLHNRLISMSVGRINLYNYNSSNNLGLCWTNGFKMLSNNSITSTQLKYLDRRRTFQIKRLNNEINRITKPHVERSQLKKRKTFFGSPYSYHHYITNKLK